MTARTTLRPSDSALDGVRALLAGLLDAMAANEQGILEDSDVEFLHEFRVALRRMRTLLSETGDVLPAVPVGRVRNELRWLGAATGGQRDLDVQIGNFAAYRGLLPASMAEVPGAHEDHVRARRRQAHGELLSALKSARYGALIEEVRGLLALPGPGPGPAMPLGALADRRIWKRYRVILNDGRRIDAGSDPAALHALRKDCKKLRYGLGFFKDLYPGAEAASAIGTLRRLQNRLGAFQDLAVQADALRRFSAEMAHAGTAGAPMLKATDVLIGGIGREQASVRKRFYRRFAAFQNRPNRALFRALFKPAALETAVSH